MSSFLFSWIPKGIKETIYRGLLLGFKFWTEGQIKTKFKGNNCKCQGQDLGASYDRTKRTGRSRYKVLAGSVPSVICPKMYVCPMAGLPPSWFYFLAFISHSLSFSPTCSSFSSPFPQIHSPWKVHCEAGTWCLSVWSVDRQMQKRPWFYKQTLDHPSHRLQTHQIRI